jgi:hypothetical protein
LSQHGGVTYEKTQSREEGPGTAVTRLAVSLETWRVRVAIVDRGKVPRRPEIKRLLCSNLTSHITIVPRRANLRQFGVGFWFPPFC